MPAFADIEARINRAVIKHLANVTARVGRLAQPVDGMFDAAWVDPLGVGMPQPVFECIASAVSVAEGDLVVIGNRSYTVREAPQEDRGMLRLSLRAMA